MSRILFEIEKISTFVDLFYFLQSYTNSSITEWLKGGDDKLIFKGERQESILRLFAGLGLIDKFQNYYICRGNFNQKTISKINSLRDIFYDDRGEKKLKDKGDSSDLTGIHKGNNKHILVCTSKNRNESGKLLIGGLDIDKLNTNIQQYKKIGYTVQFCICIDDINNYNRMLKNVESSSRETKKIIDNSDTIIIDWKDLDQAYQHFRKIYRDICIINLFSNKTPLLLKLHQRMSVSKTLQLKNNDEKKILWGHIQRSGKSYIIGGCIIKDSKNVDKCNYLLITTAKNETIVQYLGVFNCLQLGDFNIVHLYGKNKKKPNGRKNIIICSKQFLQDKIEGKTKPISWLKQMEFRMRFVDESHYGGTTPLAQKTLDYYGKDTFTVMITATYAKPVSHYDIPKTNWILWDLEDIKLCKTIDTDKSKDRLIEKHGAKFSKFMKQYSIQNIVNDYCKYPELYILTDEIKPEVVEELKERTKNNCYGWSTDAVFLLKQGLDENGNVKMIEEFQNEEENVKIWYRIFGKYDKYGISDKEFPDNSVFLKRIEKICKNSQIRSRWIGDTDEPTVILAFLPQNHIDEISNTTIRLLIKHNVIPDFEIISINSSVTQNPKQTIEDAKNKAKIDRKKGVLVLSGKQCSLGVSIDNCDIVLLLNNNKSFDMIYQMMFRSMTEGPNKKCGFVVDLNIHRVVDITIEYASLIIPDKHPREAVKYILQERLVSLNCDNWMQSFGKPPCNLDILCENIYSIYSSNLFIVNTIMDKFSYKLCLLSKDEQKVLNALFQPGNPTKQQIEKITILTEKIISTDQINVGIETELEKKEQEKEEKEETKINYMDIFKHIVPLICFLTIRENETSFLEMFYLIENNENIYNILIDQMRICWGEIVDSNILKIVINIYTKYLKNDREVNQLIRIVKELFIKNINNSKQLSQVIDWYLVPQALEKKTNAEVSTPRKLRQEMLDKIPLEFWTSPKRVFEPCSGKGGFIIDIVDRFMTGLKNSIVEDKQRYKTIVEECLYFSDINPINIFINKILVDPHNEYTLNFNEGDTLELDIKKKWKIRGFDAVIGNPPYQATNSLGTGTPIWNLFVTESINRWLNHNGYLLFVHPSGWRKHTDTGHFKNLYDIMTKNHMIYLEIHNSKDGMKTFNCGTRYDWYILKNTDTVGETIIKNEIGKIETINLKNTTFCPNYDIEYILNNLLYNDKIININVQRNCNYHSTTMKKKGILSDTESTEFKHKVIHSVSKGGIKYKFSKNNDRDSFNIPKILFPDNMNLDNIIIDHNGIYGTTEHMLYIKIKNKDEALNIKKALESDKFKNIIGAFILSNFQLDYKILSMLRYNFWKEFIL